MTWIVELPSIGVHQASFTTRNSISYSLRFFGLHNVTVHCPIGVTVVWLYIVKTFFVALILLLSVMRLAGITLQVASLSTWNFTNSLFTSSLAKTFVACFRSLVEFLTGIAFLAVRGAFFSARCVSSPTVHAFFVLVVLR